MTRAENNVASLGVLTSGGDAQGMNAAVRAVVRTALSRKVDVYAILEGYQGMVEGGDNIRKMTRDSVSGILQQGGTVIGSARSAEFRTRPGRRRAAYNLLVNGIDGLVVIGGDGSLTGANVFRQEWASLLDELVDQGQISREVTAKHPQLALVGLVGSIDNDMFGTDMTIGADTALHRITEAVDAITSTAASHQRTFIIEVMGRHCGYLTLMAGLATGANWILIPENPPSEDDWEETMCETLRASRKTGRRHNIVLVAEGARDRNGKPITSDQVRLILLERLGENARVTILGHVQRGGSPSVFDRNMSTVLGYSAVNEILSAAPGSEPQLIGIRDHEVVSSSLMECVDRTSQVASVIAAQDYGTAMSLRGRSFAESVRTMKTLVRAYPRPPKPGQKRLRLAVMHSGGVAPGMNTAAHVAIRLGIDAGHTMLAVQDGFQGLIEGDIREMDWMSVDGWISRGGAELGTNRKIPNDDELASVSRRFEEHRIDGLLMIGGLSGYRSSHRIYNCRRDFPAFDVPIVCLPASISNNLPGTQVTIGSDTALNNIVTDVDKIKQSGQAWRRCYVVEVMGGDCGYLALMSGLATGAEQTYLPEEGISLDGLREDVSEMTAEFERGKRLGLVIRNEHADQYYTIAFISALFEKEGGDLFDVRQTILGHVQRGGDPSPFDRIQASRLAARSIEFLAAEAGKDAPRGVFTGRQAGQVRFTSLDELPHLMDGDLNRPRDQWWMGLRAVANVMSTPGPHAGE